MRFTHSWTRTETHQTRRHVAYRSVLGGCAVLLALAVTIGACESDLARVRPAETVASQGLQADGDALWSVADQDSAPVCHFDRPEYNGFLHLNPDEENLEIRPEMIVPRQIVDMWGPEGIVSPDVPDHIDWSCTPHVPDAFPQLVTGPETPIPAPPEFALELLRMRFGDPSRFAAWYLTYPMPLVPQFESAEMQMLLRSPSAFLPLAAARIEVHRCSSPQELQQCIDSIYGQ